MSAFPDQESNNNMKIKTHKLLYFFSALLLIGVCFQAHAQTPLTGKVSIGTLEDDPDFHLSVVGKIHSTGIQVDLTVPAPDYVFETTYDLKSLREVEAFIKANGHLPDIPPGKRMEEQGVDLLALNMQLLEKVEELTLHLIEQDKLLKQLKLELELNK